MPSANRLRHSESEPELQDIHLYSYWNNRWMSGQTQWDIGEVSGPLIRIFDDWTDKNASIFIPGCGHAHEAEYLLSRGFTDITLLDFAPKITSRLRERYKNTTHVRVVHEDFFDHTGSYDYIVEQTFFCSLPRTRRQDYVMKIKELLKTDGELTGVLFNRDFDGNEPPFGGHTEEYFDLFSPHFSQLMIEKCRYSIRPRQDKEVYIMASHPVL